MSIKKNVVFLIISVVLSVLILTVFIPISGHLVFNSNYGILWLFVFGISFVIETICIWDVGRLSKKLIHRVEHCKEKEGIEE